MLTCLLALTLFQKANARPVAVLSMPSTAPVGISVLVDGSASHDDSPIGPQVWRYDFGDGGVTSGAGLVQAVQHTYVVARSYTVTLTITDNKKLSGTATADILVTAITPTPDTQAPSIPTNLIASVIGPTALTITWSPSFDNVGVVKYEVWMTNVLVQVITSGTTASFVSLTCAALYSLDVDAVDAAGNASLKKNLTVQTSNCPPPPPVVTASTLIFTPPTDYATNVTSCTVELRLAGDAVTVTPVATRNLGKPAVVSGEVSADISSLVDPLPTGSYYAIVVATGPGGVTSSQPSVAFPK